MKLHVLALDHDGAIATDGAPDFDNGVVHAIRERHAVPEALI